MFYSVWSNNMGGGAVPPGPSPGSATGSLSSSYRAFPEQPQALFKTWSRAWIPLSNEPLLSDFQVLEHVLQRANRNCLSETKESISSRMSALP